MVIVREHRPLLRTLLAAALVMAVAIGAPAAGLGEPDEADPIRVLVFSHPFGFSHTPSIEASIGWFLELNGGELVVDNTTDHTDLLRSNLDGYDVLVWNNSTGELPLDDEDKAALLAWVREGNGFVGIHSAADSNYTWPQWADLIGGYYDGHWYRFGGMTPEPYRLGLVQEDPDNPLLDGVPPDYDSYDETYKWQIDPRPDVRVLLSMENESIYAQGAIHDWRQPIAWCRPFGDGRTYYTNLAHDAALWDDPVFQTMIVNALRYAGGRLEADCTVPTDPVTGVAAAERMNPVWADDYTGATPQVSTYSSGASVLTRIEPDTASVVWRGVDLSGVEAIDVFATAQTIAPPDTYGVVGTPPQLRILPATGGTVEIRLGDADGPVIGSVTIPPAPAILSHTHLPGELAALQDATAVATWSKLTTPIAAHEGVHDLVLTFPSGPLNETVAELAPEHNLVGSLGWIRLAR